LGNHVHNPSGLTPYRAIGELVRLRKDGHPATDLRLEQPEAWSLEERKEREKLLDELSQRLAETGSPMENAGWGVGLDSILPMQVDRIMVRVADLKSRLDAIVVVQSDLASILALPSPEVLVTSVPS